MNDANSTSTLVFEVAGVTTAQNVVKTESRESVITRLYLDTVIRTILETINPEGLTTMKGYWNKSQFKLFIDVFESIFAKNALPMMSFIEVEIIDILNHRLDIVSPSRGVLDKKELAQTMLKLLEVLKTSPINERELLYVTNGGNMRKNFRRWVDLYSFLDKGQEIEARLMFRDRLNKWILLNS